MLLALFAAATAAAETLTRPELNAIDLQRRIDRAIAAQQHPQLQQHVPPPVVDVAAGNYHFGSESLVIAGARHLRVRATSGPGSVNLWFTAGHGVLIKNCAGVAMESLSVDYDPPAHWQGTIVALETSPAVGAPHPQTTAARVVTDPGFEPPDRFKQERSPATHPWVEALYGAAVWNHSDPLFGAYGQASGPAGPARTDGSYMFEISPPCTGYITTGGGSCVGGGGSGVRPAVGDKVTVHFRGGVTYHLLNSTGVTSENVAIHVKHHPQYEFQHFLAHDYSNRQTHSNGGCFQGATSFAISEYDGGGGHVYTNVSVGRRPGSNRSAMCGLDNP